MAYKNIKPEAKKIDPLTELTRKPTLDEMVKSHLQFMRNKKQPRI